MENRIRVVARLAEWYARILYIGSDDVADTEAHTLLRDVHDWMLQSRHGREERDNKREAHRKMHEKVMCERLSDLATYTKNGCYRLFFFSRIPCVLDPSHCTIRSADGTWRKCAGSTGEGDPHRLNERHYSVAECFEATKDPQIQDSRWAKQAHKWFDHMFLNVRHYKEAKAILNMFYEEGEYVEPTKTDSSDMSDSTGPDSYPQTEDYELC